MKRRAAQPPPPTHAHTPSAHTHTLRFCVEGFARFLLHVVHAQADVLLDVLQLRRKRVLLLNVPDGPEFGVNGFGFLQIGQGQLPFLLRQRVERVHERVVRLQEEIPVQ